MFRKLTNRITSAIGVNSTTEGDSNSSLQALVSLGFDSSAAQQALQETNGNVDRAAELLLTRQSTPSYSTEDQELQQAMQASLQTAQHPPKPRSAAAARAASAAANRAQGRTASVTLAETHPDVKVVPKFTSQSTEDQVLRSVQRFRGHAAAVDTIYKALRMVKDNPTETKYRTIDTSNAGYQRSVAPAPGVTDFWRAVGYQSSGNKLFLSSNYDVALLYLGISALEKTKESDEYINSKAMLVLDKEVAAMQVRADNSTSEAIQRSEHMQKLPSEPPVGRGAILQIQLGTSHKISRRFDADDTLQDALHWLAASHGSALLRNLESGEWSLVDSLRHQSTAIDVSKGHLTLQYLGFWPSGKLEIRPSSTLTAVENTSSRGLGAAARE